MLLGFCFTIVDAYLERKTVFSGPVYLEALLAAVEHPALAHLGAQLLTIETFPL